MWCLMKVNSIYRQTSDISRAESPNLNVSRLRRPSCCLYPIHWEQVLSRKWCSCSSANRRCSIYICVINNFIAYLSAFILEVWVQPAKSLILISMCSTTFRLGHGGAGIRVPALIWIFELTMLHPLKYCMASRFEYYGLSIYISVEYDKILNTI